MFRSKISLVGYAAAFLTLVASPVITLAVSVFLVPPLFPF